MHSILIYPVFIVFLIYLISYILSSFSVIVRKFWKKIKFTNFETAWLLFFLGVFAPPPNGLSGMVEFGVLLIFVFINFFWFIPLVYYYEMRIKQRLTLFFYGPTLTMVLLTMLIFVGWYDLMFANLWYPVSDILRLITMGFSLLYCGYLVYTSEEEAMRAKTFETYSLLFIGISAFLHGIFHIFVYSFDLLHNFEEIADAPETFQAYVTISIEFFAFAIGGLGFVLLLINTVKNANYRPYRKDTKSMVSQT